MISWFFIALVAPVLWAVVNHLDKYVLSRYQEERGVGAILIFSALSSFFILPIILVFKYQFIFNISGLDLLILIITGFLGASAFFLYLKAMNIEEASVVIPLFQIDPLFGYLLSFIFLKESLNVEQLGYAFMILAGIILVSFEIDLENKIKFKKKAVLLVTGASFMFALNSVLFKKIALADDFWVSVFWEYVGLTLFGILVFIFSKKFRNSFVEMIDTPRSKILTLNFASEVLYITGGLANNFAVLVAPVALVFVVNSYQPLFVFISGILLKLLYPRIISEKITRKHLVHKFIAIIIISIGSILLYASSH